MVIWEREDDAYYARVDGLNGRAVYYLLVEPLRDGAWDWTIWRADGARTPRSHSVAESAQEAMRAAEAAM